MDEQCALGGPACNRCQRINDLHIIQEDLDSGDRWHAVTLIAFKYYARVVNWSVPAMTVFTTALMAK